MKKQLLRTSRARNLFIVYDEKRYFYVVSIGVIKINKNGDVTSENVLYSSNHLQDCLNYFEKNLKMWGTK